jgi:hypothetical protein
MLLEQCLFIQEPVVVHVSAFVVPEQFDVGLAHKLNSPQTFVVLVVATEKQFLAPVTRHKGVLVF